MGRILRHQPTTRVGIAGRLDTTTRGRRYRELKRLKVSEKVASAAIFTPKGPWRLICGSLDLI